MINTETNLFAGIEHIFPDQVKVYDLSTLETNFTASTSLLHKHFKDPLSGEDLIKLVWEIADYLKDQDQFAVYSFFKKTSPAAAGKGWFISSARLNKCSNEQPKEVVIFSYDLDLLNAGLKKKLYRVLENYDFFKENFNKVSSLTKNEKEIICFVNKGMSSKDIADARHLSVHTVNTHRKNIKDKLSIKNFAELLKFADVFELSKTA